MDITKTTADKRHRHYDMIVAKAANMDLVVLMKSKVMGTWSKSKLRHLPSFYDDGEYFLCLPQHNENGQCLHWLNGGDVQQKPIKDDGVWIDYSDASKVTWKNWNSFMRDDLEFRIKPKKEKRYIIYRNDNVYGTYLSLADIGDKLKQNDQLIEIEVKV